MAEVSPHVPVIDDSRSLDPGIIDVVLHSPVYPPRLHTPAAGPVDLQVAAHVGALVMDGATLQIGLGSLPSAILAGLSDRNDLGVHSGLIGDAVVALVEAGVITNREKLRDRGKIVTGTVMGTERVFDFVHSNPAVILRDTSYTHDPQVLASHRRFTAINSAIEVDLSGQINTEVAAGRYVGAVGGVADFLRGAHASPEGLPVTALASTARNGASRIVSRLSGPASVSRADAGVIVTEHGSADLRGRPLAERRRMLLEIADPTCRDEIASQPFDPYA
jgi:acetyl-CoA hydrolase